MDGVVTVDVETTAFRRKTTNAHDPSPFMPENRLVMAGIKIDEFDPITDMEEPYILTRLPPFKMLVGHNIKFDLLWLRRSGAIVLCGDEVEDLWHYIGNKAMVWDTALAEYLCSAQQMQFPSLEDCCKRRGLPYAKTLDMGLEIEKFDGDTSKIEGLEDYLKNDLEMTYALFQAQMDDPYILENLDWFLAQMDASMAEAEIEWNGTAVDIDKIMEKISEGQKALSIYEGHFRLAIMDAHGSSGASANANISSNNDIAAVLFGGEIQWEEREEVGKYKSGARMGQPRYKINRDSAKVNALCLPNIKTEKGAPATSDEALEDIIGRFHHTHHAHKIAQCVRRYRGIAKSVGTTLDGLVKWSSTDVHSGLVTVHPQINNTATITGRRSSSKPNGQNWPTDDPLKCKQVLGPKRKGRLIVSVDFKQAEIMALAYVANDTKLMKDIIDGVDIHTEMGKTAFARIPTKEERRDIKTIVFGSIYGGTEPTLAVQAGVTPGEVRKILDAFSILYPISWDYLDGIVLKVQGYLEKVGVKTDEIVNTDIGSQRVPVVTIDSLTGRRYAFKGFWRQWRKKFTVSNTQPKNYFIQGFATGDLVPLCYAQIWRWMQHHYVELAELIGTIHDSVVFEVDAGIVDMFVKDVVLLVNGAGKHIEEVCHLTRPWTMPVKCDVEVGFTLGDLKPYVT